MAKKSPQNQKLNGTLGNIYAKYVEEKDNRASMNKQ
jgi:hypothetical protein